MSTTVYVRLLNEGVEVFRPVPAAFAAPNIFVLAGHEIHDPDDEDWEFLPGARVLVEERIIGGSRGLVAVSAA